MRVLLIGIDAACAGVVEPLIERGRLPALARVRESGVAGPLMSHVPPWTPSMWPSIYTGVNPGKHGVFSFLSYDGYEYELANASHVREQSLWSLLDMHGLRSVVVNVPVTHPARPFDGALIPGYMAPENPPGHPDSVLDDVTDAIGEYRLYPPTEADPAEARTQYTRLIEMRGAAFRHLYREYEPDFGFIQFQQTDTVFHEHPGNDELVAALYEAVDDEIQSVLSATDPDTVIVVSDHGIGEYTGYGFRVNTFLEEHGYLESKIGGSGMPSWVPIRDDLLREGTENGNSPSDGLHGRLLEIGARHGMTTRRIGTVLDALGLRRAVSWIVPDGVIRAGQPQVDFRNSTAYMRARIELGIRINLEGRDPDGVVPADEYEATRDALIERLRAVETPDGTTVFEEVTPRETYFWGPESDRAVDIITVPRRYDHFLTAELHPERFGPPGQPWNHKRMGYCIAAGAGIDSTGSIGGAHVFDVAPTVLALFGLPASDRMDGLALPIVESRGVERYPRPRAAPSVATESAVEDRLSDLGYLESP